MRKKQAAKKAYRMKEPHGRHMRPAAQAGVFVETEIAEDAKALGHGLGRDSSVSA